MPLPTPETRSRWQQTGPDCLFLAAIVLFSAVTYLGDLGFYSDDWAFLASYSLAEDQSLLGLFQSNYTPEVWMRPLQILYQATLYWLFGPHPLGYHMFNTGVLALGAVLFYLLLRELGRPRLVSLAIPALYVLLPHYSTDRFWYAAFPTTLSMALYFWLFWDFSGWRR